MRGIVVRISPDEGFGFIGLEGKEFFFHRNALQGTDFEELAPSVPVVFEVDRDPQGDRPDEQPRAVNIRLADDAIPAVDHEVLPKRKVS